MKSSVVVAAHRLNRWLRRCIESVLDQVDEVVVVDNGSPGAEVAATARAAGASVVRLAENEGFTGGYNRGVAAATGDVIALLNDDAFAEPGWMARSIEALADPTVAAVGPKLVFALRHAEVVFDDDAFHAPGDARSLGRQLFTVTVDGTDVLAAVRGPGVHRLEEGQHEGQPARWRWTGGPVPFYVPLDDGRGPDRIRINGEPAPVVRVTDVINNAGSFLTADGYGGDRGSGLADDGRFDTAADCFAVCGAAVAFRRDTWERVGPLAPEFFAYYEDVDWCWRAQLLGLRVRYEPSAVVRHVGGGSSGGLQSMVVRNLSARNRLLCLTRNAPLDEAWRQVRAEVFGVLPVGLRRGPLAGYLPRAAAQRLRLSRSWERSPREVWDQWAGVGVTSDDVTA